MIKNFKIYEEHLGDFEHQKEKIITYVIYYLEGIIPISKKEGFCNSLYDDDSGAAFEDDESLDKITISFYFKDYVDEDILDRFDKFIEEQGLTYLEEKYHSGQIELIVKITEDKIKEFYEIYKNKDNFNI